ncbi:branched-chain amino acid ABC transporter permease [Brevibacterium sp. 5221]|uniref:Branched-chain amino acid ABC transporter permease n=1 Tax=Brevibacterium rongguiense TaxID=2695267 RepID=A0A6N9H6H3_9MICO|nr:MULTISPECIES: branched-chain amino acid ABC transporter permease [Brevibacterium]MYM19184.1 branched-chain amino acid ABC transporter permease [Brevibacterium rongguiense]WAL40862.1 branched-chain amino acid ABC transporter permease [Brevibacterium sp. BRM-1]
MSGDWITFDLGRLVDSFWSTTLDGLTLGAIYALVALGYTLVYGVLNLINFAHSEVFIAGAFAVVFVLSGLGFGPSAPHMSLGLLILDIALAMIAAMLVSAGTALVVERVAYKPLRDKGAPRLAFLISAIGMSFVIQYLFFVWRGPSAEPNRTMYRPKPIFDVFGVIINSQQLTIIIAAVVMMVCVDQLVRRTKLGRGIRAVAQDPDTATLMGVNKERIIMATFMIGGALAGAAAVFYVMRVPAGVFYMGGFILGIKAFAAAVLGGIGNIRGALLGGLLIGLIGNYGATVLGDSQWTDVVIFVVLVVVLMVRPNGILGSNLGKVRA